MVESSCSPDVYKRQYWGLACVVTDEMAEVALKMKVRKPMTLAQLVKADVYKRQSLRRIRSQRSAASSAIKNIRSKARSCNHY